MKPSAAHPIVVKGLPAEQEARIRASLDKITVGPSMFASAVGGRLVPTEVEVFQRAKDGKMQARMRVDGGNRLMWLTCGGLRV